MPRGCIAVNVQNLTPGGFASNCFLLTKGKDALLIDCTVDPHTLRTALGERTLHAILLTHGHFDHMLSVAAVKAQFDLPVLLHRGDAEFPADGEKNAYSLFFGSAKAYPTPDRLLEQGELLQFGELTLEVLHVPGHTPGCVCYRIDDLLFTGDTLFFGGYGRTDLFGGDEAALRRSLASLERLPKDLRIYPGHGGDATLQAALDYLY